MRILFIGDVFGRPGRKMVELYLAKIQWEYKIDFTILNGENSSGGRGINKVAWEQMVPLGVDAVTMGNHVWDNRDLLQWIEQEKRLVRPANLPANSPGRGYTVLPCGNEKVAVVNLLGRVYMPQPTGNCPFEALQKIIEEIRGITPIIIVDFHGEATSEKQALAWFADGKVSAIIGTHTHVQTNDARILPKGTAYLSDAGMTGPRDSILGVAREVIVQRFLTQRPSRFEVAEGDLQWNSVVLDIAPDGSARQIEVLNFVHQSI